jgi:hypothetical protein
MPQRSLRIVMAVDGLSSQANKAFIEHWDGLDTAKPL